MKREYKIKELIKGGHWDKLAKDWGIGKEESPKIQAAPRGAYDSLRKEQVRGLSTLAAPVAPAIQESNSAFLLSNTTTPSAHPSATADPRSASGNADEPERLIGDFSGGDASDFMELEDLVLDNEAADHRSIIANSETEGMVVSEKPEEMSPKST